LHHILDEVHYLIERSEGVTKSEFLSDETLKRAFVRSLEIIGEATKNLPSEFRSENSQIEWRAIAGLRDRLIHGYFGVDYEIIWDVIVSKLSNLESEIEKLLREYIT